MTAATIGGVDCSVILMPKAMGWSIRLTLHRLIASGQRPRLQPTRWQTVLDIQADTRETPVEAAEAARRVVAERPELDDYERRRLNEEIDALTVEVPRRFLRGG